MALPAETTKSGSAVSGDAGASTLTSCPRASITSASCSTWDCTPPGTSSEYGQTIPIRIRIPSAAPVGASDRSASHCGCIMCQSAG